MSEQKTIRASDGQDLAYRKSDKKASQDLPAILFLGGFMSDMMGSKAVALDEWCRQMGIEFLRFDYRGHGESGGVFTDYSITDWADDAYEMLKLMKSKSVILIGSSMGGWIATILAKKNNPRVKGLITIAGAPDFTEDSFFASFSDAERAVIANGGIVHVESGYENPYPISGALIEGSRASFVLRDPLRLNIPVHLLIGDKDSAVSVERSLQFYQHIDAPHVHLEIVKGADHSFSTLENIELIISRYLEMSE